MTLIRRPIMRWFYHSRYRKRYEKTENASLASPSPRNLVQLFVLTFVLTFISSLLVISLSLLVLDHHSAQSIDANGELTNSKQSKQPQINTNVQQHSTAFVNEEQADWANDEFNQDIPVISDPIYDLSSNKFARLLNSNSERWIHSPFHHQPKSSSSFMTLKRNSTKYAKDQLSFELRNRFRNRLLNINNFHYHFNGSTICDTISNSSRLNLVIVIHSASDHFEYRKLIRETWARAKGSIEGAIVRHAFILGQPVTRESAIDWVVQKKLELEQRRFGDLVQANFHDTYQNLTYKHLTSLRWAVEFCSSQADYLLKMDDDAALNLPAVVRFLAATKSPNNVKNFLACSLFEANTRPKRIGKWALTRRQYPYPTFPRYCSGVGYFLTPDVAFDLYEGAHNTPLPLISIDDVFVTGLVVSAIDNLRQLRINSRFVYDVDKLRRLLGANSNDEPAEKSDLHDNQISPESSQCGPESFLIADIGSEPDWRKLAIQLWNRIETLCK